LKETLELKGMVEIEQTKHGLQNEIALHRKFNTTTVRPTAQNLNIDKELKQTVGTSNLRMMYL
jgi:hypothetical protein